MVPGLLRLLMEADILTFSYWGVFNHLQRRHGQPRELCHKTNPIDMVRKGEKVASSLGARYSQPKSRKESSC